MIKKQMARRKSNYERMWDFFGTPSGGTFEDMNRQINRNTKTVARAREKLLSSDIEFRKNDSHLIGFVIFMIGLVTVWMGFKVLGFLLMIAGAILFVFLHNKYNNRSRNDDELSNILEIIGNEYRVDRIMRDEREFETDLYRFLKTRFPEYRIKPQYRIDGGRKV